MRRSTSQAALVTLILALLTAAAAAQPAPPAAQPAAPATQPSHADERFRVVNQPDEIVSVLMNGTTVIAKRVPSPAVSVRGYVRTGGIYEDRWLGGGLSHLLEHLVAGGSTRNRTEAENRELLQSIGNNSNAYTTTDHTAYFINTTPEHMESAVDLLTGWLFGALITPEEYAREYEVVQRELEKGKGEPFRQFYYLTNLNRYRVHPARVPVIGYQEVIQGLSRDDVYEYYKLTYQPQNLVFSVAGDLPPEEMLAAVQEHANVPPGREYMPDLPAEPPVLTPRTIVATFPQLGQAQVQLGFPTITLQHPDLYAMDLLSGILGDGESALLVEELRDRRQLVSSISAGHPTPEYVEGTFQINMRLDPQNIDPATQAVLEVIERIQDEGVSDERLERAKTRMRTSRIKGLQTAEDIASSLANDYLSAGDIHFTDHYIERIQQVSADDVQRVARKYFDRNQLLTTVMLPAEAVGTEGLPAAVELVRQAVPTTQPREDVAIAPEVTKTQLSNGTILLHKRITTTPIVAVNMFALGGLTAEDAETNGMGNLAMSTVERGTETRSAADIAQFFDSIGADFAATSGNNTWYWNMTVLADDLERAMEVYADVVSNPSFPEDEVEAMKARIVAAIRSQDADWTQQAMRFFRSSYFGPRNSPYQFMSIGTAENVASFTADDVRAWYRERVLPSRRVLAIYGDVELGEAQALAERYLGQGEALPMELPEVVGDAAEPQDVPDAGEAKVSVTRVEVNPTQQPLAGVIIGFNSDSVIGEPTNDPIMVGDTMTSGWGYPTGYLHEILRGRGLVYVVHAQLWPGVNDATPGTFMIYAGCDPRRVNEVVDIILENIARLQGSAQDMQEDWFERSKALLITSDAMDNQTASEQAMTAALDELYGLGYDYHERFDERIEDVAIGDVQRAARRKLTEAVITVSTPLPDAVEIEPGVRTYESFPPVELTPGGVTHDAGH